MARDGNATMYTLHTESFILLVLPDEKISTETDESDKKLKLPGESDDMIRSGQGDGDTYYRRKELIEADY